MRARRRPVVDEYAEQGRTAIYTDDGMVLLLSELATTAWELLGAEWVGAERVTAELVREHGDPAEGDAARLTEDALRELADMGLVELDQDADR
jgi:hypothetical protein